MARIRRRTRDPRRHTEPVRVTIASKAPTLDGVAAPGEWPEPDIELKQTPKRDPIKGVPCRVRLCSAGDVLCVAVTVPVPDASAVTRGSRWGEDDAVEVCLRREEATGPSPTVVVQGFAGGHMQALCPVKAPKGLARDVERQTRFKAAIGEASWTAEFAIPLAAAGMAPKPGMTLAFNIGVRRTQTPEWIIWSGTMRETWRLDEAGYLRWP